MQFTSWGSLVSLYERAMRRLLRHHRPDSVAFEHAAEQISREMAERSAKANARSWREAAIRSKRPQAIHRQLLSEISAIPARLELDRIARENAGLIRSIPEKIARHVTSEAAKMQVRGARAKELERYIKQARPRLTQNKIRLIARTEISRAETDLTRYRSRQIGIRWYQWQTSEDQRVRPSHRNMDKVLVAWDDPPAPERLIGQKSTLGNYDAGGCPQCRCLCLPVADLAEIRWPARVHVNGRIVRMTRPQFERMDERIAA